MVTKLRDDFKVNIQLPKKEGDSQEEITITGLEENAEAAKNEILKIVGQYESMVKMEVNIDAKVHSMIIGRGGKSIRNIMEKYKVDIRLPRAGDEDPSLVLVSGNQDACEDCIDHLKIMQEDFIQEAAEQDWERDYMKPTWQVENKESNKKKDGFMVSKARKEEVDQRKCENSQTCLGLIVDSRLAREKYPYMARLGKMFFSS